MIGYYLAIILALSAFVICLMLPVYAIYDVLYTIYDLLSTIYDHYLHCYSMMSQLQLSIIIMTADGTLDPMIWLTIFLGRG